MHLMISVHQQFSIEVFRSNVDDTIQDLTIKPVIPFAIFGLVSISMSHIEWAERK